MTTYPILAPPTTSLNGATAAAGQYMAGYTPSGGFNTFPYNATGPYSFVSAPTWGGGVINIPTWGDSGGGTNTSGASTMSVPTVDIPSAGPLETPNEVFASVAGQPIPVSGGRRRINGRPIDRIFRALNADGSGARVVMHSCGYPLFEVSNTLSRVTANATTIWEDGAVVHPDVTSVTWYEGDEAQIQDPVFAAKNGAFQPAYRGQMIGVVDFTSLRDWNNVEPAVTYFITDGIGGTRYAPWTGTWDPTNKSTDVDLSGGDLTADNNGGGAGGGPQGSVLGTIAHTAGRYTFSVTAATVVGADGTGLGMGIGLVQNIGSVNLDFYIGSQTDGFRWGFDGTVYLNGIFAGTWDAVDDGETAALYVDLTTRVLYGTKDGVVFWGSAGGPFTSADLVAGINGFDFSAITGSVVPSLTLAVNADSAVGEFANEALFGDPFGDPGDVTQAEIIVATGVMSKLDTGNIEVDASVDDVEEGIIITNGLSWVDYLKSTGSIENFDFWEYGSKIYVKRVAFDSPTIDLDGIPVNHRLKCDEEKGSTLSSLADERRKPSVINLSYIDDTRQFQNSMVPARSEVPDSAEEVNITSPLVMPAYLASLRANIALFKTEMEAISHSQCFPPIADYLALLPADVVRFSSEGKEYTTKVKSWSIESDFLIRVEYHNLLSLSQDLIDDAREGIPTFSGAFAGGNVDPVTGVIAPGEDALDPYYPQTPGGIAQRLFPMHLMGN